MKVKVKLRDMTQEQYKKWSDAKCAETKCCYCLFRLVNCDCDNEDFCWVNNKEIHTGKFLDQEIEIEVEGEGKILNEEEREYLSAVVKPFRDRVEYIKKLDYLLSDEQFIHIVLNDEHFYLPLFKENEYYQNMEVDKEYTLEELGL